MEYVANNYEYRDIVNLNENTVQIHQEDPDQNSTTSDYCFINLDSRSFQKPKDEPKSILINVSYAGQKTYLTVDIEQTADHSQIPTYESVISAGKWNIHPVKANKMFQIENFITYTTCLFVQM